MEISLIILMVLRQLYYIAIMVNDIRLHFKRLEHYPKSIGKDNYYNIFEVIDSMHALYEKNVCLLHVNQIPN